MHGNRLIATLAAMVLVGLTLAACGTTPAGIDDVPKREKPADPSVPLSMREIVELRNRGTAQPSNLVIRDVAAWEAFWASIFANVTPRPVAPTIDFTKEIVLYVAAGQRPTGGYSISVDSVWLAGGDTRARVLSQSPGARCITTQVLTAPAHAVAVTRSQGQIVFVNREETKNCG